MEGSDRPKLVNETEVLLDLSRLIERVNGLETALEDQQRLVNSLVVLLEAVAAVEGSERLARGLTHLRRKYKLP